MPTASADRSRELGLVPWKVVLLAITVAIGFRWLTTATADLTPRDLEGFETVSGLDLPDVYGTMPFFLLWTRGDGATFVALAADPLIRDTATRVKVVDIRITRIGYSLLALAVVGGSVALVPVGLFVVNTAAVGLYAWLTARLALDHGRTKLWLLANLPILIGYASDSAEPTGLALALAAMTATTIRGTTTAAVLAGTVRPELTATIAAGRRPLAGLVAGGSAVIAVQAYAVARVGSDLRSGMNISLPPMGYLEALPDLSPFGRVAALAILAWALTTIVVGATRRIGWQRLAWVGYGLLIASLSANVIHSGVNVVRVSGGLLLLWLVPVWNDRRSVPTDRAHRAS